MTRKIKRVSIKRKNNTGCFSYIVVVSLSAILAVIVAFNLYLASLKPISNVKDIKPNPVTAIYSSDGENIKTFTAYKFEKVSIDDIPDNIKNAVIATEDKNFYHHRGFDTLGLVRSAITNLRAGKLKQGASTITQQLARILFLSNERTFDRKIKELIIAHRIEKTISKDEILDMYLNSVYLGSGTYGVLSASKTYFDKNLDQLTLAEAALIAGLPQAPSVYSPFSNPDAAIKRRNQVLKRMYKTGYINKKQYKQALDEPLKLNQKPRIYSFNKAPYFIDFVLRELTDIGFDETEISQGGLKIYTTLNYKDQKAADDAINNGLSGAGLTANKTQMALFAFSPTTGKILAYVGGKNYEKSQYDRIVNAIRPPGSSFKPFVYAAALQQGFSVNDIIEDKPVQFNKWAPRNYGDKYRGKMPLWKALALSSNVIAATLIDKVGVGPVISIARDLGITTPLQPDLTISLGSNGVKLYDMVVAYGAFANGGFRVRPYAVERVENSRGVVIYEAMPTKVMKVISYDTAAGMTYMLKKVVEQGTGRGAAVGREVAGKTGTTDDYRDAWFMGYSPDIVAGVWLGNDDNSKLPGITGGGLPARVWGNFMKVALSDYPESVFDYPDFTNSEKTQNTEAIYVNEQTEADHGDNAIVIDEEAAEGFNDDEDLSSTKKPSSNNVQTINIQQKEPVKQQPQAIFKNKTDGLPSSMSKEATEAKNKTIRPVMQFKQNLAPAQNNNAAPLPGGAN